MGWHAVDPGLQRARPYGSTHSELSGYLARMGSGDDLRNALPAATWAFEIKDKSGMDSRSIIGSYNAASGRCYGRPLDFNIR